MAKPLKETLVLSGNDAVAFVDKIKTASNTVVSAEESARIREDFAKIQAIAKS